MAKTLTNLRAQVRTYLDEATTADWTVAEVDREINVGYMKAYAEVVNVYEDYYSTTTTLTTIADQQEYGTSDGFPTDFYKMRRVELDYTPSQSSSVPRRAIPVSMDSVLRDLGNSALGISVWRNPAYYLRGNTIGFIPVPTEGGSGALKLWYIKTLSELSSGSDEIDIPFPDRYFDSIVLEAVGTLLRKGQQEERVAMVYLSQAQEWRDKMRNELEDRIADDTKSITDTIGEDVDFSNYSTI